MSPAQNASRLRDIATELRVQRLHVLVAEMAVRSFDPQREDLPAVEQIEAVSELLQDIARRLDRQAAGILAEAEREAA